MTIGVTDTMGPEDKFLRYVAWLTAGERGASCTRLSYAEGNAAAIDKCDALLLTGGHDVDPALYDGGDAGAGRGAAIGVVAIDRRRDDFELAILRKALRRGLPVLGICRGLQLANVAFGGSLIADLETAGYPAHRSAAGECAHDLEVDRGSLLFACTGAERGRVNSSHHQAAGRLGSGLVAVAHAPDGVVEALEHRGAGATPFFLLIQWHPERMGETPNPFAGAIRQKFFSAIDLMKTSHTAQGS